MSLIQDYYQEREEKYFKFIEDKGFFSYTRIGKDILYVVDIYLDPEFRQSKYLDTIYDEIVILAKELQVKTLMGTTHENARGWDKSHGVLLKYGFIEDKLDNKIPGYHKYYKEI